MSHHHWHGGDALEDEVTRRCLELMAIPNDTLATLLNVDDEGVVGRTVRVLGRRASIVARRPGWPLDDDDDDVLRILVAGTVPMRWWPVGSWRVIDGFEIRQGQSSKRMPFELLDKYW